MSNHWTKEQEEALDARGQNLLLSAAAGSGKTAVLTERIIRLVETQRAIRTSMSSWSSPSQRLLPAK